MQIAKIIAKITVLLFVLLACVFQIETQAMIEHFTGYAIGGGYCRVLNIKELHGSGQLRGGLYTDKTLSGGHVRGFKNGKVIELACRDCQLKRLDADITIKDYKIVSAVLANNKEATTNLKYVRGALIADYIISQTS